MKPDAPTPSALDGARLATCRVCFGSIALVDVKTKSKRTGQWVHVDMYPVTVAVHGAEP
jgi:hypothetical protein